MRYPSILITLLILWGGCASTKPVTLPKTDAPIALMGFTTLPYEAFLHGQEPSEASKSFSLIQHVRVREPLLNEGDLEEMNRAATKVISNFFGTPVDLLSAKDMPEPRISNTLRRKLEIDDREHELLLVLRLAPTSGHRHLLFHIHGNDFYQSHLAVLPEGGEILFGLYQRDPKAQVFRKIHKGSIRLLGEGEQLQAHAFEWDSLYASYEGRLRTNFSIHLQKMRQQILETFPLRLRGYLRTQWLQKQQ